MTAFKFLDKRVQRTKLHFYDALMELLGSTNYDEITVKDIVELAGYSRGAFYNHYNHKDDLLEEVITVLFEEAAKAQRTSYLHRESIDIQGLSDEPIYILEYFDKYREQYKVLLGDNLTIDFHQRLKNFFMSLYLEDFAFEMSSDGEEINDYLFNKYNAYGTIGLIIDWITDEAPLETKEFSKKLVEMFRYSFGTLHLLHKNKKS